MVKKNDKELKSPLLWIINDPKVSINKQVKKFSRQFKDRMRFSATMIQNLSGRGSAKKDRSLIWASEFFYHLTI